MNDLLTQFRPTPNRRSRLQFDLNNSYVSEPAYSFGRPAKLMFKNKGASYNSLEFVSGWRVKSYHEDITVLIERIEAADDWLTSAAGTLILADDWDEYYLYARPDTTEMPGAITAASANLAPQAYKVNRKGITAGNDFSAARLLDDETAFPFNGDDNPYGIDDTIHLDRVAKTTDNDNEERDIFLSFLLYGSSVSGPRNLGRVLFTGPAGDNSDGTGQGLYGLVLNNTGRCFLFERLIDSVTWIKRHEFHNDNGQSGNNSVVYLRIYKSKTCKNPQEGPGGYIKFDFLMGQGNGLNENDSQWSIGVAAMLKMQVAGMQHASRFHYSVPNRGVNIPSFNQPIRIDIRRDLLGSFNLAWFTYPTDMITADDAPFKMTFSPQDQSLNDDGLQKYYFKFNWTACKPTGTTVYATLHRLDNGDELARNYPGGEDWDGVTTLINYKVPESVVYYFVRWHIQATSTSTPEFREFRISREQILKNTGQPIWEIGDATHPKSALRGYTIRGAERDLGQESIDIDIVDPLNNCTELKTRANGSMRLVTQFSTDTSLLTHMFYGFANRADAFRQKPGIHGYPVTGWNKFKIHGKGVWQLLEENFVDTPFFHLTKPSTTGGDGQPWDAAELIKELISRAAFNKDTAFDFPATSVPIFATTLDYSQNIDMLEKLSQVVKSLARDYLSQILIHDPNVTASSGIWRLIDIPTAPYKNVAAFTTGDVPNPPSLTHYMPSYGTIDIAATSATQAVNDIPLYPITEVRTFVKPPEANWLMVAAFGSFNEANSAHLATATRFNPKSYDMGTATDADPDHPDYLGRRIPLYVIDPSLGQADGPAALQAAVNALARRIDFLVFHAIKMMTFSAPIGFIQNQDRSGVDVTGWFRKLRYYDPVYVDGAQWLIRNINPTVKKDGIQYAMFELEAPRI